MPNWVWWVIIVVGGSIIIRWIFRAIEEAQEAKEERIAQRVAEKLRGEDDEYDEYDWSTPVEDGQERKDREAEAAFEEKIAELGKDNWRLRQ